MLPESIRQAGASLIAVMAALALALGLTIAVSSIAGAEPTGASFPGQGTSGSAGAQTVPGQYVVERAWKTDESGVKAIHVGADGIVNVAMTDRVSRYSTQGVLLGAIDIGEYFSMPYGLAIDPAGNLHVASYAGNGYGSAIYVFSAAGAALGDYAAPSQSGQYFAPWGLEILPDGRVVVANATGDDLKVFTSGGQLLASWSGQGSGPGQLERPIDVAYSPSRQEILVADAGNHRIQRFTTTGQFIGMFGQAGAEPGQFEGPKSLAVLPNGNILVLDQDIVGDGFLNEFSPEGVFLGRTQTAVSRAFGLAVDSSGAAYITGLHSQPTVNWGVAKYVPVPVTPTPTATPTPTPTATPTPTPTATPTPPASTAKIVLKGKKIGVNKKRTKATFRATCRGAGRCAGTVQITLKRGIAARGRYSLTTRQAAKVTVRLTAKGRKQVRRSKQVRVVVRLAPTEGQGAKKRMLLVR